MIKIPEDIAEMIEKVKPYKKNAIDFVEDTPQEIIDLNEKIKEFYMHESEMV